MTLARQPAITTVPIILIILNRVNGAFFFFCIFPLNKNWRFSYRFLILAFYPNFITSPIHPNPNLLLRKISMTGVVFTFPKFFETGSIFPFSLRYYFRMLLPDAASTLPTSPSGF